ncbi:MAG: 4'-phosphopantetheinyl transferase superfamily protein, partial [Sphingobacteriaceae bacterium]|nr:4'-phosphopantetheinyl transferase superfamily protein [Sphingobacteriaceae bacterium]
MLGNDIVDLQLATTQSNWRRKGYLNKIFTNEEQQEIWNAPNPETMVWLFWSMKEAAYKIVNRVTLERFFSPLKFECSINKNDGLVNFKDELIYTQSKVHSRFIHTIASIASTSF